MKRTTLLTVLAAAMLVLAGCGGAGSPAADGGGGDTGGTGDTGGSGTGGTAGGTDGGTATGTVEFYVSDRPGEIDQFRHLNVTIDRIAFQRADGGNATGANTTATPTNATNGTAAGANGTADADSGSTIVRNVSARSVDLTRLKGANATLVGTPTIPAGNYTMVKVYVENVTGVLEDGTRANVKLPSNTLKLNKGFSLAPNGSVTFVYDISVFEAGNSGKYVLKPVISESGPDKQVKRVDDGSDDAASDGDHGNDNGTARDADNGTAGNADNDAAGNADDGTDAAGGTSAAGTANGTATRSPGTADS